MVIDQYIYPLTREVPFPIRSEAYIETVGVFRSKGDFYWEQTPGTVSIHCIHSGKGCFETGGSVYTVEAGEVFIFWPGQPVRYWDTPETPWKYTWINVAGSDSSWLYDTVGATRGNPHCRVKDIEDFNRNVCEIVENYKKGDYTPLFPFYGVIRLLDALKIDTSCNAIYKEDSLGRQIKKIIDSNHLSVPRVEELAQQLQVHRVTVYRAFQQEYNLSIKEYIEQNRLDKACQLLAATRKSIKEIAYLCGYSDPRYFSRTFCSRFSYPPGTWRKMHAESTIHNTGV